MKVICRIEKLRKIVKRFGSSRQNRVHKDVLWLVSVYSNVMISCFDLLGQTTVSLGQTVDAGRNSIPGTAREWLVSIVVRADDVLT